MNDDDLLASARRWVEEVEAAYADGGYAAGDGPSPPLDEVIWLLAEVDRLRAESTVVYECDTCRRREET